ncbi:flavin reductase family protein [Acinetobacter variabilis]|uniref:flavin reductase family protein n=1 Tax=Acinetobacter variabilis TaxID=70346 RepID=UPI003AF5052C
MKQTQRFLAEEADTKQLRGLLGQFATGVTVVTTTGQDGRKVGMTANSFTSVSLEPPLILWNIAKTATNLDDFRKCEHFAINILNEQQEQTSNHFAKSAADKFNSIDQVEDVLGIPVLSDALATLVCKNYQWVEAGDHYIILGQIEHCSINSGKPLLFHNGKYHQAQLHPVHLEQCA